eukprot:gnl/MRDRNA2_/MRDRNA2_104681_c0_seq1.p1 gnl/MRDRNA2_/MRDRNA2_104681_c0~~gnl/MRDRNA2_/MRDRNA2_104681_c0_seq1.p1  ORF type:complete len:329 (+),score=75.51 gnl/MRDRNA2_/MRDRNA2_104681_c0_seq1:115-1101(+)
MPDSGVPLAEPLLQQEGSHKARCGKVLVFISSIIALGDLLPRYVHSRDGSLNMMAVQKKIDPSNGMVFSFEELTKAYTGQYSPDEIQAYWNKDMRPAKLLDKDLVEVPDVRKVDPDDKHLRVYSFKELSKKYQETKSEEEIKEYWEKNCKQVKLMERPTEAPPLQFRAVFMDQKGSRYHDDLRTLEDHNLMVPGSVVVADNCLKPGAPLFLWRLYSSGCYDTDLVSLKEFAMPAEDWMAVTKHRVDEKTGKNMEVKVPDPPAELTQLQWESDRIRDKATRSEGGVTYGEWASYSQDMKAKLKKYGIGATHTAASFQGPGEGNRPLPSR